MVAWALLSSSRVSDCLIMCPSKETSHTCWYFLGFPILCLEERDRHEWHFFSAVWQSGQALEPFSNTNTTRYGLLLDSFFKLGPYVCSFVSPWIRDQLASPRTTGPNKVAMTVSMARFRTEAQNKTRTCCFWGPPPCTESKNSAGIPRE